MSRCCDKKFFVFGVTRGARVVLVIHGLIARSIEAKREVIRYRPASIELEAFGVGLGSVFGDELRGIKHVDRSLKVGVVHAIKRHIQLQPVV